MQGNDSSGPSAGPGTGESATNRGRRKKDVIPATPACKMASGFLPDCQYHHCLPALLAYLSRLDGQPWFVLDIIQLLHYLSKLHPNTLQVLHLVNDNSQTVVTTGYEPWPGVERERERDREKERKRERESERKGEREKGE